MGASYTWTFEQSFLIFVLIIFVTQALSSLLKSYVPMPLLMGGVFILCFGMHWFPDDMILSSNMIAVGTIAFNVLVIHSGTMISASFLRVQKKGAALCLLSTLILFLVVCFGLRPVIGKELSLLAPGSIVGGGASCAIASRWVVETAPRVSVFPWLIFMFQGLFSVPLCCFALKRESALILDRLHRGEIKPPAGPPKEEVQGGLVGRIPARFKTTAYYLGIIMTVSFVNRLAVDWVNGQFGLDLNVNMTALILGFLLGHLGLMDKAPLYKSDSCGLLLLGLMGLMANTLATTIKNGTVFAILGLLPPLLLCMAVGTAVMALCGALLGKRFGMSPWRGMAMCVNCITGFPVNGVLVERYSAMGGNPMEQAVLKSQLGPVLGIGTMLISNGISIFIVSILVSFI